MGVRKVNTVVTHQHPDYEKYLNQLARHLMGVRRPCADDLIVAIVCEFVVPVPKSIKGTHLRKAWREALAGDFCYEDNIGDVDNLLKPIADTLEKRQWLANDSQLAGKFAIKRYCKTDEQPCTILTLLARSSSPFGRWSS